MMLKRLLRFLLLLLLLPAASYAIFIWFLGLSSSKASVCHGSPAQGRLEGGGRLPYSGENFRAYSLFGFLAGRTFVHPAIRDVMRETYAEVARQRPELRFVYGEIGWPWGGRLWPHKTHANGTAVDFMVPVRTSDNAVSELPTHVLNEFGYGIEFDQVGRAGDYHIDFEAMALHLTVLEKIAAQRGVRVQFVIFDPPLQAKLFATPQGAQLAKRMSFTGKAWIRHDEHYHVNFAVPCR